MVRNTIEIAGVEFKNPFVVASGPASSNLQQLKKAEEYGAGAVSTKLTFRELPFKGEFRMVYVKGVGPIHISERRLTLKEGTKLIQRAKEETSLKLFANMTSETPDLENWVFIAKTLEKAGADLIEANFCCPMVGLDEGREKQAAKKLSGGAVIGENKELAFEITKALSSELSIPIICKLSPTVSNMSEIALACQEGGADGISLFGGPSYALPPVDIENNGKPIYPLVKGASYGFIAGPSIKHATYKRVAEVASAVNLPVIASGGINSWRDAIEMMMWGASAVSAVSCILREGWEIVSDIIEGMENYLKRNSLESYDKIIGQSLQYLCPASQVEVLEGYAVVNPEKCIGCNECLKPVHCDAIEMVDKVAKVDKKKCTGCGMCQSICPVDAIDMKENGSL